MRQRQLTHRRLVSLLSYEEETGIFTRLAKSANRKHAAGSVAGGIHSKKKGHIAIQLDGQKYLAHILAWFYVRGEWPVRGLDHINRNGSDNRYANLRLATESENGANRGAQRNNTSGYKGVSLIAGKWRAQIKKNGKVIYLGRFSSKEDARLTYLAKARELFGEFACAG